MEKSMSAGVCVCVWPIYTNRHLILVKNERGSGFKLVFVSTFNKVKKAGQQSVKAFRIIPSSGLNKEVDGTNI